MPEQEAAPRRPGRPKGTPKTGGRAPGTPNKVTASLKEMILGALSDVGGRAYLAKCAREEPKAFLPLLGRVLPREITGEDGGPVQVAARLVITNSPTPRADLLG